MSIEISRETEARLNNEARRLGISLDALLERFVEERAATPQPVRSISDLPIWRLGGVGALHRRDIYDDAR
jgi:hypothetical protein